MLVVGLLLPRLKPGACEGSIFGARPGKSILGAKTTIGDSTGTFAFLLNNKVFPRVRQIAGAYFINRPPSSKTSNF